MPIFSQYWWEANLRVDGIYFMAPACRVALFESNILPHYRDGKVSAYTEFHLTDVGRTTRQLRLDLPRSLLYLVSNAFEHQRGMPFGHGEILQSIATADKYSTKEWTNLGLDSCADGKSPNRSPEVTRLQMVVFSGDDDTREAVLERLEARRNTPTASGVGAGPSSPNRRSRPKKPISTPPSIASSAQEASIT